MSQFDKRMYLRNVIVIVCLIAETAFGQTAREVRGAPAVEPIQNELPARIVVDPPLAEPLSHGRVIVQYRTENLHMTPVFGAAALAVSPRIGHIHVTVDDASWVWVEASGEPVILNGLLPGAHKIRLQLESANHQLLDQGSVAFTVPESPIGAKAPLHTSPPAGGASSARIIIDPPAPEPLSRGVVFLSYRAEDLRIVPVYGPAALAVSPRIGHVHVTIDDATWHWADASGVPVIINGLTAGSHKILIELVNANHQRIDRGIVLVTVPAKPPQETH